MNHGKRAEAAFFHVVTPHFESARRQRITDPNARTCAIEDLVYHQQYPYEVANDQQPPHPGYERPTRPSRPVSLELREYLSADRRPDDSHPLRELHETLSDSATFVRKKVRRGARALLVHRISIFAALLLGAAVVAVVAPERVHTLLHPNARAASARATTSTAAQPVSAPSVSPSSVAGVQREESKTAAGAASPAAASSVRSAKHVQPREPSPKGSVLAIRKDRAPQAREDKDSGWTVASPVSTSNTPASQPSVSVSVESDRAKQDLAAVTAALANTL